MTFAAWESVVCVYVCVVCVGGCVRACVCVVCGCGCMCVCVCVCVGVGACVWINLLIKL